MDFLKEINSSPIRIKIPVQWGDMDAANHVNNVRYMRWTESSRIAFFEKFKIGTSFQNGIAPILAWQDCKYILPLTFPDTAIITCNVIELLTDRFVMESKVYSSVHERLAAISNQRIMAYDYNLLKKAPLPMSWLNGIDQSLIDVKEDSSS